MNARGGLVADLGGGKFCPFARYRDPGAGAKIVVVDVSEEELAANDTADEKRVADLTRSLPFADGEADLLASRYVLEHLGDLRPFLAEAHRVLKPGGLMVHLLPSRYAPFAVLGRLLSHGAAEKVLYHLKPEARGISGFPSVYRDCTESSLRKRLGEAGFEVVEVRRSYYQSRYYSFLVPLYLASAAYETAAMSLGLKGLASYLLVVARKK
jgi:SAM-dependent methyltransferase